MNDSDTLASYSNGPWKHSTRSPEIHQKHSCVMTSTGTQIKKAFNYMKTCISTWSYVYCVYFKQIHSKQVITHKTNLLKNTLI